MKNYRWHLMGAGLGMCLTLGGCSFSGGSETVKLDVNNPTQVTIWHYYNGTQLEAFDKLIREFNETEGRKQGIIVEAISQGNVQSLEDAVLDAVEQKAGKDVIPSIFASYADTAYEVDQLGYAVDLKPYLTEKEQEEFVDSYLEEGMFSGDGSLKIFPTAKSTEIFVMNRTDWNKFANATGADIQQLDTMEGVLEVAEQYYEWTDSLTEESGDGKAFFGRDAMANYMLIGARQMGVEIFQVSDGKVTINFDKDIMRKLWESYYVPYVKGYFASSGGFRSDDVKTGNILAFVGSSSGAMFFPSEVVLNDTESYPIELEVRKAPKFKDGEDYAVQQGAGMVVTKKEEAEIYASVQFLKWFTQEKQNIQFAVSSGYLPVTEEANQTEVIQKYMENQDKGRMKIVEKAIETVQENKLYTPKAFARGTDARSVLEYGMSDPAEKAREKVVERMKNGMSMEEAAAEFISDEAFESWYQTTKEALEGAV